MSVERLLAEARKPYADKIMALEAENMELAEQLAKAKDAIDAMVAAQQAELQSLIDHDSVRLP